MNKLLGFVFLIVACFAGSVRSQVQYATLYEGVNCAGASITISDPIPDLSNHGFDNRARSARLRGMWLFYDSAFYNPIDATMEYAFGVDHSTCINFQTLGGYISSTRYSGFPSDYRLSTITFYEHTYFQGIQELTSSDRQNLNLYGRIKSLIVTGSPSQGWTLYERPDFTGNAVCIYPPQSNDFEPAIITDTRDISVPHGTIGSVRKGCFGLARESKKAPMTGMHLV